MSILADGGYMYFHFLIEDQSGKELIDCVMEKVVHNNPQVTYFCKGYHGLGGFTKKNTVKETRDGKLLNDLMTVLRGLNKSLQGIPAAIIIVLDNDDRDTEDFREKLENVASENMITIDHVFCIAVEEMEAWLLGDEKAVLSAYPKARMNVLHSYEQDSICGTWEKLADVVYPGGLTKLMSDSPSYMEIGKQKCEWSKNIARYMDLDNNHSPSFNFFMGEIGKRIYV